MLKPIISIHFYLSTFTNSPRHFLLKYKYFFPCDSAVSIEHMMRENLNSGPYDANIQPFNWVSKDALP